MTDTVEAYEELDGVVAGMVDRVLSAETTEDCDRVAISSLCAVLGLTTTMPEQVLPPAEEMLRLVCRISTAADQRTRQLAGAALREAAPWLLTAHPQTPAATPAGTAAEAAVEGPPDRAGADGPPARPAALRVVPAPAPAPASRTEQP